MTHDPLPTAVHTRRHLLSRLGRLALGLAVASRFSPDLLPTALARRGAAAPWPDALELAVSFSFKAPAGRYNRPYTAVWIEDENGQPVRTLSLWASSAPAKLKYLAELRRWWKAEGRRRSTDSSDLVSTVSSPTRLPGSYTVVWDGRNDRKQAVPQGQYVLQLELAREDGPYARIRQALTIGNSAFRKALEDEGELTDVVAELRPRRA